MTQSSPSPLGRAAFSLHAGFFLSGAVTVVLGPLIPEIGKSWGMPPAEAASLFVAQFVSSSLGAVLSSLALRRSLVLGYAVIAVGLAALAAGGRALAFPAMALVGGGLGLSIPATNIVVALARPGQRGAALSRLNLVWGLGAVASPLLFASLIGRAPAALLLLATLAAAAAVALASTVDPGQGSAPASDLASPAGGRGWILLVPIALQLFVYVGTESAIGGWLVALADQLAGDRSVASLLVGSGFWGALLAGRAAAPRLLASLSEPTLFGAALAVAASGALLLLLSTTRPGIAAGAVLAGAGLAPLFPLTVSALTAATEKTRSRGTGWVFAMGGLGGAVLPWMAGRLGGESGTLRRGFLVPAAGIAVMAALFLSSSMARPRGKSEARP